jgi:hypothetical protein
VRHILDPARYLGLRPLLVLPCLPDDHHIGFAVQTKSILKPTRSEGVVAVAPRDELTLGHLHARIAGCCGPAGHLPSDEANPRIDTHLDRRFAGVVDDD